MNFLVKKVLNVIKEQNDDQQWAKISAEEFKKLLEFASYNTKAISKIPLYKNKKIWIVGDLKLSNLPISSLEGVSYVEGNLDISNTNISDLTKVSVKGRVIDWNSGVSRIREKKIKDEKINQAKNRRLNSEFSIENDDYLANTARAIFDSIINNEGMSEDDYLSEADENRLNELYTILENLDDKKTEYANQGLDTDEIYDDEEIVENEIEELEQKFSIYHLIPYGGHYELKTFEIIGFDDLEGQEYAAGDEEDSEQSAKQSIRSLIDDVGYDGYSDWVLEDNIDKDKVEDYARDFYDNDVRENPESYFDDDDYELSDEQAEEKERIEAKIAELEEKQNNLEHEIEEPSDYSRVYDEVQEEIDNLQEMLDEMEPDKEPSEKMIDNKIQELVDEALNNPVGWLKDWGYEIKGFIDEDSMVDYIFDSDGYSSMSSYDGDFDIQNINGTDYYVFRLN